MTLDIIATGAELEIFGGEGCSFQLLKVRLGKIYV